MIINHPPFIIHHLTTLGSTNDHLKTMIDAPEFTCVVADEQTAGRGRRARAWHSSPGDGLYLSVLLRPRHDFQSRITLIGLMAAVSVAESLIERGVAGVDIKWPNDVMANDRKLCGILAEAATSGAGGMKLILGIGVNLNHESFSDELSASATSIAIETGNRVETFEFRDRLLDKIASWYEKLRSGWGEAIVDRWQQLSSYARDQRVAITLDEEIVAGVTAGLTETGALRLLADDGSMKTILAGEVARLRRDGK
jgi:BirA family biotin operon repressor/biotin-[acetyl-CoA-carboxylase] ligase